MNKTLKFILIAIGTIAALIATWFAAKDLITWDIWDAVAKDRVAYVQKYLDEGGDANLTKLMVWPGGLMNDPAREGDYSLLMQAAYNGSAQVTSILVQHGARVNAISSRNNTPLLRATRNGNLAIIKLLIDHKADINYDLSAHPTSDGSHFGGAANTPIATAIFYGHIDAVRMLLDAGARITQKDIDRAEAWNMPEIAESLKKYL